MLPNKANNKALTNFVNQKLDKKVVVDNKTGCEYIFNINHNNYVLIPKIAKKDIIVNADWKQTYKK